MRSPKPPAIFTRWYHRTITWTDEAGQARTGLVLDVNLSGGEKDRYYVLRVLNDKGLIQGVPESLAVEDRGDA